MEDIEKRIEVGKASVKAMLKAKELIRPGASLLDVAEQTEKYLRDMGFGLAFPINLSLNSHAAHYAPSYADGAIFSEGDIVKIDFGAERDGMLGDGAISIEIGGEKSRIIEAANAALEGALSLVKDNAKVCDIGREIDRISREYGFNVIKNLGGHGVEDNDLHHGLFIPNYDNNDDTILEEGMVIAIEPFLTTGVGMVADGEECEIYSFIGHANVRSPIARALQEEIEKNYTSNPFAARWLFPMAKSKFALYAGISELARAGALEPHPVLIEVSKGDVAQAEAEVLVEKDGYTPITKI